MITSQEYNALKAHIDLAAEEALEEYIDSELMKGITDVKMPDRVEYRITEKVASKYRAAGWAVTPKGSADRLIHHYSFVPKKEYKSCQ